MLLTWTSLIRRSLSRGLRRSRLSHRPRNLWFHQPAYVVAVENLEERVLLFTMAINDSYNVTHDHTITANAASGVIANDFGMGSLTATLVSSPAHGTLNYFHSDGSFSFAAAHYVGSDSFTYKDWDGSSWSNTATVTLNITNAAPSASPDSYTINKDIYNSASEGAASLLANDSDSDGDSLTASLVTAPSHGSVTVNSDGSYVYTKTSGYTGSDSFVYAASDGFTHHQSNSDSFRRLSLQRPDQCPRPALLGDHHP